MSGIAQTLHISYTRQSLDHLPFSVWHETLDLSDSKCVFVHSDNFHAKSLDVDSAGNFREGTRACEESTEENTMQRLVQTFCQHLERPKEAGSFGCLDEETTLLAAFLLQHLFKAWDNGAQAFKPSRVWPFGIKGVKKVARTTVLTNFAPNVARAKGDSGEPVNLTFHWGHGGLKLMLEADINQELRKRGLFKFIVHPYPVDVRPEIFNPRSSGEQSGRLDGYSHPDFGLLFMIQHTSRDFVNHFVRYRETFTDVLSLACSCFLQSLDYFGSQQHLKEQSSQQEGRKEFLKSTRLVSDDAPARKRNMSIQNPSLVQEPGAGDITQSPVPSTSQQHATTTSLRRASKSKRKTTSESSSTTSTASSSDTFVTAVEEIKPDEDHQKLEDLSIAPEPASLASNEPTLVSTFMGATSEEIISEDTTKNIEEEVVNTLDITSQVVGDTQDQLSTLATQPSEALPEVQLATEHEAPSIHEATVPFRDSHFKNSPDNSPRIDSSGNSSQTDTTEDMGRKKLHQDKTRRKVVVMAPIHEEQATEIANTGVELQQASTTETNPAVPQEQETQDQPSQDQATGSIQARKSDTTSRPSQILRQPASNTSSQAVDLITNRILRDSRHGSLVDRPSRAGQMSAKILSSEPLFSYNQPHKMTNCWLSSCDRPTASSDGRTVICPRCGDHSYVRYCSITHLIADMRDHYTTHCGRRANLLMLDERTVTPTRQAMREFIKVAEEDHDSVERHRQALYHAYPPESDTTTISTRPPSDYYIFSDADRFDATGLAVTVTNLNQYRGTGSIAGRVRYNQNDPRKGLFATLLERLLVLGVSAGTANTGGCRMLFVWIKENLAGQGEWTEIMITRMCLAMQLEFGWNVDKNLRD